MQMHGKRRMGGCHWGRQVRGKKQGQRDGILIVARTSSLEAEMPTHLQLADGTFTVLVGVAILEGLVFLSFKWVIPMFWLLEIFDRRCDGKVSV